jgi:hypothetical protein
MSTSPTCLEAVAHRIEDYLHVQRQIEASRCLYQRTALQSRSIGRAPVQSFLMLRVPFDCCADILPSWLRSTSISVMNSFICAFPSGNTRCFCSSRSTIMLLTIESGELVHGADPHIKFFIAGFLQQPDRESSTCALSTS